MFPDQRTAQDHLAAAPLIGEGEGCGVLSQNGCRATILLLLLPLLYVLLLSRDHSLLPLLLDLVNRRPEYVGHRKVIGGPDVYSCLASTYLLAALHRPGRRSYTSS